MTCCGKFKPTEGATEIPVTALTLRDHFAACALTGLVGQESYEPQYGEQAVAEAFRLADAMLTERAKGGSK